MVMTKTQSNRNRKSFCQTFKNGFVAVLDIMGFSSYIENHTEDMQMLEAQLEVAECMRWAKEVAYCRECRQTKGDSFSRAFYKVKDSIQTFQFSDTLIFVLPDVKQDSLISLLAFTMFVAAAVKACFDKGFPVSGAIEYGDCSYNFQENFLLGAAFVKAHEAGGRLGFSGVVVSPSVVDVQEKSLESASARMGASPKLSIPYELYRIVKISIPKMDGTFYEGYCLDWMLDAESKKFKNSDLRQLIVDKFVAHGKTLTDRVVKKIENTELVIRQMLSRNKRGGCDGIRKARP